MPILNGSCLCGGIKFEINGPLVAPNNCHCTMCSKQHGAAFPAVPVSRLAISNGYKAKIS